MTQDKVQITSVRMSNVKGIKYIEIKPKQGTTVIGGRNGSCKTTLCESVGITLGGAKLMPKRPIRKGQTFAFSELKLSECKSVGLPACTARVEFTERKDGTIKRELTVKNEDGDESGSPQTILDGLISSVGFDPLSFLKAKPKDQLEIVRDLVGIDFTQLDAKRERLYEQRTKVNSKADDSKARCGGISLHGNIPDEEVSVGALMKELKTAQSFNQSCDAKKADHQVLINRGNKVTSAIADVMKQIEELEAKKRSLYRDQEDVFKQITDSAAAIDTLVYKDVDSVSKQITDSEKVNQQVRKKQEKTKLNNEYEAQHELSLKLTEQIDEIDATKKQMVSEAKWPIQGMSFSQEYGLAYNDIPLDQLCQSEGIRVSVAIGAALNPTLPYMFIKDASLLDDEGKIEVATVAAEHGCQLFMELVGKHDSCDVVMEDGEADTISDECTLPPEEAEETTETLFK